MSFNSQMSAPATKQMGRNWRNSSIVARILLALFVTVLMISELAIVKEVAAQDPGGIWSEPVNVSLSAAASDPVMIADSSGQTHIIWKEPGLDFVYTTYLDGHWTTPEPVELPFGTRRYDLGLPERQETPLYTPVLWPDRDDRVHALWVDDEGQLFYSSVLSSRFANFFSWSVPRLVAASASAAAAITDSAGRLHAAYVRPAETGQSPAGLYYQQWADGGSTWSPAVLLFESRYFRSLNPDLANLQLTAGEDDRLVLVWDDPFQERVYASYSENAGQDWAEPLEIDRRLPSDGAEAAGPNGIRVVWDGETMHLVWLAGHDGLNCAVYHQVSNDGGASWEPAMRVMESLPECPDSILLMADEENVAFMLLPSPDGGWLAAWHGDQWGQPQELKALTAFLNPMNYREVRLGCHQAVGAPAEGVSDSQANLTLLGCDTAAGSDIWVQTADKAQVLDALAPEATPVWQSPISLGESSGPESLQLLADADGWLHALWTQVRDDDNFTEAIQYSRWDGVGWSGPKELLTSPGGRPAVQPSAALSMDGKIMAVWTDGRPGSIYFSQANLARAGNVSEWSSPLTLPTPLATGSSPMIALDRDGIIYVAYAVPLNEERGVYITKSDDGGETWLEPLKLFDGADAGWSMVDSPRLALGGDGSVHILWTRYTSPPDAAPQAVYYARSTDGGQTWSEATEVTETPANWKDIVSSGELTLHRFWDTETGDIWHQSSSDSGANWGQSQRVSGSGALALSDVVTDGAGRPWLLQVTGSRSNTGQIGQPGELRIWVLSDGRWTADESLRLIGTEIGDIAAATTGGGIMGVVFSSAGSGLTAGQDLQTVYYSARKLNLPLLAPTPLPTLTPTPLPETTQTPTPPPMPTATTVFPTDAGPDEGLPLPIDASNPLTGPLIGIIPAGIVVLIAFFIGVRLLRSDRR